MTQQPRKPNIVVMLVDQMRFDGPGCNGNTFAVTPNLDRFAATGTNMQRCISANPVCMPSRASLLTGRYPSGHGLWHNGVALPRQEYVTFDPETSGITARAHEKQIISHVPTMADAFAASGYHTRAIGKLHLTPTGSDPSYGFQESRTRWASGELDEWHGPYYGFEHVDLTIGHGEEAIGHYRAWLRQQHPEVVDAIEDGAHRRVARDAGMSGIYRSVIPEEAHHSTWIGNMACDFLREVQPDAPPFLLYLGFPDPHHPFAPPAALAAEFEQHETLQPHWSPDEAATKPRVIADLIAGADSRLSIRNFAPGAVFRARQYTDAMTHLIDRAVGEVLATLDEMNLANDTIVIFTSDHGDFLGDHGLILKDTICSDALVHVPFMIRAPGRDLPSTSSAPMSNADILPTLCELAGVGVPAGVQGRSIVTVLEGGPQHLAPVFGYQHDPANHNFSIYDDRYRFTLYPGTGERELYDHQEDPWELANLAGSSHPREAGLHLALLELHLVTDNPAAGRIARF